MKESTSQKELPPRAKKEKKRKRLKIDLVKCSSVFSFLHSEGHDITLLQECNIPYKSNYRPFQDRWKYGHSIWSGDNKNKSSGVVILFRGWYFEIQQVQEVVSGRLLYVDVKLNGIGFRIINVYCPTDLQEWKEILKEIASILICGSIANDVHGESTHRKSSIFFKRRSHLIDVQKRRQNKI
uniref:Endonuclease/exonuclease/phosphatase domain-containing protein n=1 Tax=Sinocyclocheilus grahami TaxID=75366 RepID=A0A672RJ08_SINGR